MSKNVERSFLHSAGVLLLITSVAKFISSGGNARILNFPDPIFLIPFRYVFWVVGGIELIIALVCFSNRRLGFQAGLIAWLATNFGLYRIGLRWIGYNKPCTCLGNLTDALHIPPQIADDIMKIVLGYLFIGSYAALFYLWRQRKRGLASAPAL